ncbi:MAG: type II toxin-antitoxin system RelE/ParE family toxin [Anaerolineales bacterium]|nr:type II toxin-antitoxin system RelE/ParE family toxin [Anaerolineales bacterium]MDP3184833.1 type II toxin-antitoxin system RelE/ParE family toxin [Anaerolineales bacterium]
MYQVIIKRPAEKELDTLPENVRRRIVARLLMLEENPRPSGFKKLRGEEAFRLRVGDYRVLYTIDDRARIVTIYAVGHRREVYRR